MEQEKVDRILEAGRMAPTAVNKQPVHIWAVSRPETLEAIKGVTRSNYGAPLLLVVGCRPADAWVRRYDGKNGAEVDAAIVATYLMLAAENEGLATLWVGSFVPIHRHRTSSETAVIIRGKIQWVFYDDDGNETERVTLAANGEPRCLNVERERWHSLKCLESGSVLFECKDGPYAPLGEGDMMEV